MRRISDPSSGVKDSHPHKSTEYGVGSMGHLARKGFSLAHRCWLAYG